MRKTGSEIENDVVSIINGSTLKNAVTGLVYLDGARPKDSVKEDIVVAFQSGSETSVQEGEVHINVYVPSTGNTTVGFVKNTARCLALERLAMDMVDSTSSVEYDFDLGETITSRKVIDVDQYVVNVKLLFKRTIN